MAFTSLVHSHFVTHAISLTYICENMYDVIAGICDINSFVAIIQFIMYIFCSDYFNLGATCPCPRNQRIGEYGNFRENRPHN